MTEISKSNDFSKIFGSTNLIKQPHLQQSPKYETANATEQYQSQPDFNKIFIQTTDTTTSTQKLPEPILHHRRKSSVLNFSRKPSLKPISKPTTAPKSLTILKPEKIVNTTTKIFVPQDEIVTGNDQDLISPMTPGPPRVVVTNQDKARDMLQECACIVLDCCLELEKSGVAGYGQLRNGFAELRNELSTRKPDILIHLTNTVILQNLSTLHQTLLHISQKLSKYSLSKPSLLSSAVSRRKKIIMLLGDLENSWTALCLELGVCMAKSSEVAVEGVSGRLKKLAIGVGLDNWDEFDLDDASKLCLLGDSHIFGFGTTQSYNLAYQRYTAAAKLNHPKANLMLGTMHEHGFGTVKSPALALDFFKRATCCSVELSPKSFVSGDAENESPKHKEFIAEAYNKIGKIYQYGVGVDADACFAEKMYREAANRDSSDAMTNLGLLLESQKNFIEAVKWYMVGVAPTLVSSSEYTSNGNPRAMNALGSCYFRGEGVEKNYGTAVEWFRKGADLGNINAVNNLGVCYESGTGVPRDLATAKSLYLRGAENLHPSATNNAGYIYVLEKQYEKAIKMFLTAAALSSPDASYNLAKLYETGIPENQQQITHGNVILSKDLHMAETFYRTAISQNHYKAKLDLAQLYLLQNRLHNALEVLQGNEGVEVWTLQGQIFETMCHDPKSDLNEWKRLDRMRKAAEFYEKASEKGYADAIVRLGLLYQKGEGVEQNENRARKLFQEAADRGNGLAKSHLDKLKKVLSP
ncbi:hypothetical protein HK098_003150 [Nowakowskiella sp. JEL0407]|nr:hypothetical protein HK098_003150 [Nowakowskiella sp. JEL0407]